MLCENTDIEERNVHSLLRTKTGTPRSNRGWTWDFRKQMISRGLQHQKTGLDDKPKQLDRSCIPSDKKIHHMI